MSNVERTLCSLVLACAKDIMLRKERELSDAVRRAEAIGADGVSTESALTLRADVLRASRAFDESVDLAELALRHFGAGHSRPATFARSHDTT